MTIRISRVTLGAKVRITYQDVAIVLDMVSDHDETGTGEKVTPLTLDGGDFPPEVDPENTSPTAAPDANSGAEEATITGNVLTNDTDTDGDTLTVTTFVVATVSGTFNAGQTATIPSQGALTINSNGAYSFVPVSNFNGAVRVATYSISDGAGGTDSDTLTLTVTAANDPPVAVTDTITVTIGSGAANGAQNITAALLSNDTDVEGATLTVTAASKTSGTGTVSYSAGVVTFTTPGPATSGSCVLNYTVSDGALTASVSSTVNYTDNRVANSAPVAVADSITVDQDSSTTFNPLANDTDADGNPLTISDISGTAPSIGVPVYVEHGYVTRNSGETLSYFPYPGYFGADSFTYKVNDGTVSSASATVSVTVTEATGVSPTLTGASASRMLEMATWGPTEESITTMASGTLDEWLEDQLSATRTDYMALQNAQGTPESRTARMHVFWTAMMSGADQLRQRLAFAWSQIWVSSEYNSDPIQQIGHGYYYDKLSQLVFGSFRTMMETLTLTPAMGQYLSAQGNQKENTSLNRHPDQNFAREIMQLFCIGLIELNQDGTPTLDGGGLPIPTYTQDDVEAVARIFTGWNYSSATNANWDSNPAAVWNQQMISVAERHDVAEKVAFGVTYPAGQTAQQDLDQFLDFLLDHPNTAPFIAKQLIQRLVSSNPSPAYVTRVANVFDDDGTSARGNLWAVTKAVLSDAEALGGVSVYANFGKLREPLLGLTILWRGTDAYQSGGEFTYDFPEQTIGQGPLLAPSVFNFFEPGYSPPGEIKDNNLVAPEFQLFYASFLTRQWNSYFDRVYNANDAKNDGVPTGVPLLNVQQFLTQAETDVPALVARLNLQLAGGRLTSTDIDTMEAYVTAITLEGSGYIGTSRATNAIYQILVHPEAMILR